MLRIYLEARQPLLNMARAYCIDLSQDLFGQWILKITYGRKGTYGHCKSYCFNTAEEAYPKIQAILKRRATAPQRSGCRYQLIDFYQDPSLPPFDVLEKLASSSSHIPKVISKPKTPVYLPLFDI